LAPVLGGETGDRHVEDAEPVPFPSVNPFSYTLSRALEIFVEDGEGFRRGLGSDLVRGGSLGTSPGTPGTRMTLCGVVVVRRSHFQGEATRKGKEQIMAAPSLLSFAYMADRAYEKSQVSGMPLDMGDYNFQSWTIVGAAPEDKEGFHGAIYSAPDKSCSVVAFAGTEDGKDLKADMKIVLNRLPNQRFSAMNLLALAAKMEPREIYLTGHSLGGALAQIVSVCTLRKCVSFNSPCMKESIAKIVGKNVDWHGLRSRIVNYRMTNDPVSGTAWGTPVGNTIELDQGGKVGSKLTLKAHYMDQVIAAIQREGLSSSNPLVPTIE
jgi:hypothetical protein